MNEICAKDILAPNVILVDGESRIQDVARDIRKVNASHAVVLDGNRYVGVVSLNPAYIRNHHRIFLDLLPGVPNPVISSTTSINEIKNFFSGSDIDALRVDDEKGNFIGIITEHSFTATFCGTSGVSEKTADMTNTDSGFSSHEKEILLKELHHRVKNNLQLISSLLSLQQRRSGNPDTVVSFQTCIDRIKSIALVHDHLYLEESCAEIDFTRYIELITENLFLAHRKDNIEIILDTEDVFLDLNRAIPCGLIINELIVNCLKHAFPQRDGGIIRLNMQEDKAARQCRVSVCDNGVGLPKDLDINDSKTTGFIIINTLAKQLRGTIRLDNQKGTACMLSFPLV